MRIALGDDFVGARHAERIKLRDGGWLARKRGWWLGEGDLPPVDAGDGGLQSGAGSAVIVLLGEGVIRRGGTTVRMTEDAIGRPDADLADDDRTMGEGRTIKQVGQTTRAPAGDNLSDGRVGQRTDGVVRVNGDEVKKRGKSARIVVEVKGVSQGAFVNHAQALNQNRPLKIIDFHAVEFAADV